MKIMIRKLRLIAAILSFLLICFPAVTNAAIISIHAIEDSVMLDGDNANNPFPGILGSELDTSGDGSVWLSVLKFDLSPLAGLFVNSASLELTSFFNHSDGTFSHEVFSSSDDSWTEGTITGVNRPLDSTLTLLDSTSIGGISQTYSWDVLTGVLGIDGVAGSNNMLTFLIRPELSQAGSGGFGPHFNDRDSNSGVPVLRVDAGVNSVPVPASIWLFCLGFIGFFWHKNQSLTMASRLRNMTAGKSS